VLGYVREHATLRDVVLLNIGAAREPVALPDLVGTPIVASTHVNHVGGAFAGVLEPDEAVVLGPAR